jgi:CopG family nickel-responsive transcriptional regulator
MAETVRFGVSLDMDLLDGFDKLIRKMGYDNRSEAIRDLIREKIVQEEWQEPAGETFGIAFLVYDHEALSLDKRLTDTQHNHVGHIVSTLHVHIDESNCVEVVMLKGPGKTIRAIGEKLVSMRGIKYGKLTMGTTGQQVR